VVVARGDVLGGPDWLHYTNKTWRSHKFGDGYEALIWPGVGEGWHESTLKPPPLLQFTVPAGSHFPPPNKPFWLDNEVFYVVTQGRASINYANGTKQTLWQGCMFYSAAGIWQGPITNVGTYTLVVMVLADFSPKFDNPPAILPTILPDEPGQVAYRPKDGAYTKYPGVECLSIQPFEGAGLKVGAIAVEMEPDCTFPFHFHPTGAFYFFTHGTISIAGDGENVAQFVAGDGRWARPGWAYGPELSKTKVKFMVLGIPPTLTAAPNKQTLVVRKKEVVQVAYTNTQYKEPASLLESKQAKTRPARVHLRSRVSEDDESVLLQYPSHQSEL